MTWGITAVNFSGVYPLVNQHSNGKSPFSIGHQQESGVIRGVHHFLVGGCFTNPFETYGQVKMGIMKPRNRGENSKNIWVAHHLVILHHTFHGFTDPNLFMDPLDPFAALRACLRKASAIRLHTSWCKRLTGMYVKPPTSPAVDLKVERICVVFSFSIHSRCSLGSFWMWDFSSSLYFSIFFPSCILLIIFGASLMAKSIGRNISPNILVPSCKAILGSLDCQSSPRFFCWKIWQQSCEPIPDLPPRQIGIPKFHHPIFHDVTFFFASGDDLNCPKILMPFVCQIARYRTFLIYADIVYL